MGRPAVALAVQGVPEEAAAVYNALAVVENCAELRSQAAEAAATGTSLLEWVLRRLRPRLEVRSRTPMPALLPFLLTRR